MKPIPGTLLHRPFTRAQALDAGATSAMLRTARFVRVHLNVWRHADHVMSDADWIEAAALALPTGARTTGLTRIQQLGLDHGPRRPVRYVVEGDHHLSIPGIFLHRTRTMPPTDDVGVVPEAAYISFCRRATVLDAVKVGDWLLNRGHMSTEALLALALAEPWRDGAHEAIWMVEHLNAGSRSLPESELRTLLVFAGLPAPEVNVVLPLEKRVIGDLVYWMWRLVVEYEGGQHQEDRGQYVSDIDRYAYLRDEDVAYVQVTKELLKRRRQTVSTVHRALCTQGYTGPGPSFAGAWDLLDARITDVLGPRRDRRLAVS